MGDFRLDAADRAQLNGLMGQLADGDRAAFQPIFRALLPRVRAWCAHLLRDSNDADDAAQLALVRLFSQASGFNNDGDVLSWAMTIATWECRTFNKKRSRQYMHAASPPATSPTPEHLVSLQEQRLFLKQLLGGLTLSDQRALLQSEGENVSARTAKGRKQRQRALARLKKVWRERHGS